MAKNNFDTRPKKLQDHSKLGSTGARKSSLTVKQRALTATAVSVVVATILILDRFAGRKRASQRLSVPLVGDRLELRKKKVIVQYPALRSKKRKFFNVGR